jgi:hypothetical protein
MKLEITNGHVVGTAEWRKPGEVSLDIHDASDRAFFQRYFSSEDSFLSGSVGEEEMFHERPDASEEAFMRAVFRLARYSYRVQGAPASMGRIEDT